MRMRLLVLAVLVQLAFAPFCHAWSYKEHILFTRLAILRLVEAPTTPPEMKRWLADAVEEMQDLRQLEDFFLNTKVGIKPTGIWGISRWSYMPDERSLYSKAADKVEPFGVHEKLLHYVDLELFVQGDAKREYRHDLSSKPRISDIPRDMADPRYVQAGMLPFRTQQCYDELVRAIREDRLHAPNASRQEGATATYWAGYLAHYLADSTQPHHSSVDYKSQSYFANRQRSPNIHAEMEYRMCDDEVNPYMELRKEYWPLFMREVERKEEAPEPADVWQETLETAYRSYDALPLIGLAAMHAAGQRGTPDKPEGAHNPQFDTEAFFRFKGSYLGREMSVIEMKAIQTAAAVKRIERTLLKAWNEAKAAPGPATLPRQ